ncbi:MAG TPA: protease pro-enzyme activation domain-containing protein [Candidatus Baltobacteraceae bacterium]|jgi:kumamolisin|nr:protease pro-enzyme activation domain-containing protein [Candidatus Baltobacteraceae bacterium]
MRGTRFPAWSAAVLGVLSLAISACSHPGSAASAPDLLPYAAPQRAAELRDRGRRAKTQPVDVAVILRLNHRTQLDRLIEQISRPHSARYHHFLTTREFAERFAPTAAQTRTVAKTLQQAGFQIVQTYSGGTLAVYGVEPLLFGERRLR